MKKQLFSTIVSFIILTSMLLLTLGCQPATPEPTATPTIDSAATQAALDAESTANAAATADAEATLAAEQTLSAQVTATAGFEQTKELRGQTATATAFSGLQTKDARATSVVVKQTEQAAPIYALVQDLMAQGYLETAEGDYYSVSDYDESWAQLGWYLSTSTHYSPENFVITADASWESAYNHADWAVSGCGFVFKYSAGGDNHYVVFLGMDGWGRIARVRNGVFTFLGKGYYGKFNTPDKDNANMTLISNQNTYTFLVNGEEVFQVKDSTIPVGELGLTLVSGTNKDWGIRCKMVNISVWILP